MEGGGQRRWRVWRSRWVKRGKRDWASEEKREREKRQQRQLVMAGLVLLSPTNNVGSGHIMMWCRLQYHLLPHGGVGALWVGAVHLAASDTWC